MSKFTSKASVDQPLAKVYVITYNAPSLIDSENIDG